MTTFEKFAIAMIIGAVVICGYAVVNSSERSSACKKAGGEMVKTMNGWMCAELKGVL